MMSKRIRFWIGGFAALVVALVVAACGSSSSSSSSTSAAASSGGSSSAAAAKGGAIRTASGPAGTYLVGPSGRALYLWVADHGGKSSCSGACASIWPPLIAKSAPTGSGAVKSGELGTITRSGGVKQVTYGGHPLYYYVADKSSGQTTGEGSDSFGAKWWLVAPAGTAITSSKSSGSSGGSGYGSSSSSSSGGNGY